MLIDKTETLHRNRLNLNGEATTLFNMSEANRAFSPNGADSQLNTSPNQLNRLVNKNIATVNTSPDPRRLGENIKMHVVESSSPGHRMLTQHEHALSPVPNRRKTNQSVETQSKISGHKHS